MSNIKFDETGWADYLYWQMEDRKTLKKVNALIKDIERNGYDGIGKPEKLMGDRQDYWSRRIDEKNRLVYRINNRSY